MTKVGQVDSTEFAELDESAENYNYLSSSIKQHKNYLTTYSDAFSWILSVKNDPNFIFREYRVFGYGPIPKNENAEFAESFRNFHLLYHWWIVVTVRSLITWYYSLYTIQTNFQNYSFHLKFFSKKKKNLGIGTSFAHAKIENISS